MPLEPILRDELLAMTERELAAAEALFDRCDGDPALGAELERLLAGPATPLIPALAEWEGAPAEARTLLEVNAGNVSRLGDIIDVSGWPGLRLVGSDGADAAWMLAQHADRANKTRQGWLDPLAAAVASGDADPRHLATLTDRTAVVGGRSQRYGTVVMLAPDSEPEFPVPVEDAGDLDGRRAAIGLPSLRDEAPHLGDGELVPYGPDRAAIPVNQWPMTLEGHVSVEAALDAGKRHIHRVWAERPGDRRLGRLRALARERDVVIEQVDRALIDELASGRTHGGVIGLVGPRRTTSVDDLLAEVGERPFIVMLDGIEDPYNFGQAVRALYAAGVNGLVIRRSWETALATVVRASAGASELLPTASVSSADEAATICRLAGLRVAVAVAGPAGDELHTADLNGALFLLVGGERRGVTRSLVEEADQLIRIGYGRERAPELGAATSAAIIAFEALRQRTLAGR